MTFSINKEELRRARNLVEVGTEFGISFEQRGPDDFWSSCPFHDENTPSFHVRPRLGFYKCFGCGESGDVFSFVQKMRGLSFREAIELLAPPAGAGRFSSLLDPQQASASSVVRRKATLKPAWTTAESSAKQQQFAAGITPDLLERLSASIGLDPDVLARWDVGFAPDLRAFTFPMLAPDGSICGFRTRALRGDKFAIEGSRNGLFVRRETLSNLGDTVLVTEGITDAIAGDAMGYLAVGLPAANQGHDMLINLLKPDGVSRVNIIADRDDVGRQSGLRLAKCLDWRGYDVRLTEAPNGAKDLRAAFLAGQTRTHLDIAFASSNARRWKERES